MFALFQYTAEASRVTILTFVINIPLFLTKSFSYYNVLRAGAQFWEFPLINL